MATGSMLVKVWTRDDETGVLDDEFRDGDVAEVRATTWLFGSQEKKSWLIIKVDDVPNIDKFLPGEGPHYHDSPLVESEYGIPETPGAEANPVTHKRKYRIDWRSKFSAEEIVLIRSAADMLPDGQTAGGGTVVDGIVQNLFTYNDILRK